MKSRVTILVGGIAVGVLIHSYWSSKREAPFPAQIEEARVASAVVSLAQDLKTLPLPRSLAPVKEVQPVHQPEAITAPAPASEPQRGARPSQAEEAHGLVINEENVTEMERVRDQLRNYALTTQTPEGWKIQILPEDEVFLKAGLRSGDLITFQSMDGQLQNPERAQLAARMVAILNQIQR